MRNEMKSATGERNESDVPIVGMEGLPLTEEAEESAWRRYGRWENFWYWPGWLYMKAVGQILLLAGLFLYSGPLLRLIDPTAASLDAGIAGALLLAVLAVDTFVVSAWLLLRLIRNTLTEFYEWDMENMELKRGISSCLKAKIICGTFWGLLSLLCLLFWVLV